MSTSAVTPALPAHLRRARDHVDRRYREPCDLAELAAVAGEPRFHSPVVQRDGQGQ